jgi:hypothetical protein
VEIGPVALPLKGVGEQQLKGVAPHRVGVLGEDGTVIVQIPESICAGSGGDTPTPSAAKAKAKVGISEIPRRFVLDMPEATGQRLPHPQGCIRVS